MLYDIYISLYGLEIIRVFLSSSDDDLLNEDTYGVTTVRASKVSVLIQVYHYCNSGGLFFQKLT